MDCCGHKVHLSLTISRTKTTLDAMNAAAISRNACIVRKGNTRCEDVMHGLCHLLFVRPWTQDLVAILFKDFSPDPLTLVMSHLGRHGSRRSSEVVQALRFVHQVHHMSKVSSDSEQYSLRSR